MNELERDLPRCFRTVIGGSVYRLRFQHLQLAMARHRQGPPCGIPLEELAVTEIQTDSDSTVLMSVEPRIISEELYLRIQQWYVVKPGVSLEMNMHFRTEQLVCSHLEMASGDGQRLVDCKLSHHRSAGGQQCDPECLPSFLRCTVCDIEFETTRRELSGGQTALCITKWLNLGSGESPQDPKWRRSCDLYVRGRQLRPRLVEANRNDGVAAFFEAQDGKKYELLAQEHASILEDRSFATGTGILRRLFSFTPREYVRVRGPLPGSSVWFRTASGKKTACISEWCL
jgi:hypothetical protein